MIKPRWINSVAAAVFLSAGCRGIIFSRVREGVTQPVITTTGGEQRHLVSGEKLDLMTWPVDLDETPKLPEDVNQLMMII